MKMIKRWGLCCVIVLFAGLLIVYCCVPAPVVVNPQKTEISVIHIDSAGGEEYTSWVPISEQERETAKEIVDYLATCKQQRTFRRYLSGYPAAWDCITIMLSTPNGEMRGVLLGPEDEETKGVVNITYNAGDPSLLGDFQGDLMEPEKIREYVLSKLESSKQYLATDKKAS